MNPFYKSLLAAAFSAAALHSAETPEDWQNEAVFRINKEPAAATMKFYPTAEAALKGGYSSREMSLNGSWKFMFCPNPSRVPAGFYG